MANAESCAARPDPRPLLAVVDQGIRSMENSIFNNYPNSSERDEVFGQLRGLVTALGRMATRAELAEAEAQERKRAELARDAVERCVEESL